MTPSVGLFDSPNHGGPRKETRGCVLHATHGRAETPALEFSATLRWFATSASQVSAHVVIAVDGAIAVVVLPDLVAWHCRELNESTLSLEFVQANPGDPITDRQYASAAWWLKGMAERYHFVPSAETLPEHRETAPGVREGKIDVGPPFDRSRLLALLGVA